MPTYSDAVYNAMPIGQRGAYHSTGNGQWTTDNPPQTGNPLYGYDAATNAYKNVPGTPGWGGPQNHPSTNNDNGRSLPVGQTASGGGGGGSQQPDYQERLRQEEYQRYNTRNDESNRQAELQQQQRIQQQRDEQQRQQQQQRDDALRQQELARQDALRKQQLDAMKGLMGANGGTGGTGGVGTGIESSPLGVSADNASFARAKDRAADMLTSRRTGIQNQMAARGLAGSGIEGQGLIDAEEQGQGQLGDVSRERAITGLNNAMTERGQNVTLHGQNLDYLKSLYSNIGRLY